MQNVPSITIEGEEISVITEENDSSRERDSSNLSSQISNQPTVENMIHQINKDHKRKTDFVLVFEEDKKDAQLCQLPTVCGFSFSSYEPNNPKSNDKRACK